MVLNRTVQMDGHACSGAKYLQSITDTICEAWVERWPLWARSTKKTLCYKTRLHRRHIKPRPRDVALNYTAATRLVRSTPILNYPAQLHILLKDYYRISRNKIPACIIPWSKSITDFHGKQSFLQVDRTHDSTFLRPFPDLKFLGPFTFCLVI